MVADAEIDEALRALLRARGAAKSICPSEAARAVAPEDWRSLMKRVKGRAVALEEQGELVFLRKGKVMAGADVKGVYRLSLPR